MVAGSLFKTLTGEASLAAEAAHDPQAFTTLYNFYFPRVFTYIRVRVLDDQTADDLAAQVFERALTKIGRYQQQRAPFGAWLFGIARNTLNNHLRTQRRHSWISLEFLSSKRAPDTQPEDLVQENETQKQVWAALRRLPDHEQELVLLKYVAGLSTRQIAGMTGYTESNISVILFRARQQLKTYLIEPVPVHAAEPAAVLPE